MFDLEFQGQRSRSQHRYIFFWILRYQFRTNRHQTQVSTIYTTRDSILDWLCHAWPWISKSKVNHETYFLFPEIYSVIVDTKHKFLWHILPEISLNVLRHVWPWISKWKVKVIILTYLCWILHMKSHMRSPTEYHAFHIKFIEDLQSHVWVL